MLKTQESLLSRRRGTQIVPPYIKAMMREDAEGYSNAMSEEVKGLERQETWTISPQIFGPKGKEGVT